MENMELTGHVCSKPKALTVVPQCRPGNEKHYCLKWSLIMYIGGDITVSTISSRLSDYGLDILTSQSDVSRECNS